jgi:hypothetical protein
MAWAGQVRAEPNITVPGTWVTFDDFYVGLHVVAEKGARRSIALPCFVRKPRGLDVYAACGQLKRMELVQFA